MNVLDIYPTFAWWLCGSNWDEIAALRASIKSAPETAETNRNAYFLVGDAVAFDLVPQAFDEIVVHYPPTPLKRMVLERQARRWLSETGVLRLNGAESAEPFGYLEPATLDAEPAATRVTEPAAEPFARGSIRPLPATAPAAELPGAPPFAAPKFAK